MYWSNWPFNVVVPYKDTAALKLYGGMSTNGYVMQLETSETDDGQTITWHLETREMSEPDERVYKLYRYSWLTAKALGQNITFNLRVDQSQGVDYVMNPGSDGRIITAKGSHSQHGHRARFKLSGPAPAEIYGFSHEGRIIRTL